MNYDIEYLLFLQTLRESAPAWLNAVLSFISELAISPFVYLFPAIIFWCVSKEGGVYLLLSQGVARSMNALIKDTACVYRPWIRDSRVQSSLIASATGYSFPSGHTTIATAVYGGCGVLLKKKTGKTWLMLLCFVPALATGFARNWFGAHTPQDVVIGFLTSVVVLYCCAKLAVWLDQHQTKDVMVTIIVCAACAVILLYVSLKPYPLDYAADGSLLVDPAKMTIDAFGDVGMLLSFILAWLAERRFVRFTVADRSLACRAARGAGGCVLAVVLYKGFIPVLQAAVTQPHASKLLVSCIYMVMIVLVYPALFTFVENRVLPKQAASGSSAK